jgi:hypothetical protein
VDSAAQTFTAEEAREVAQEDFNSDTKGKKDMTMLQLGHSLYELACVWAKAQIEQCGLPCTTEHLVYFLTEMFKNIAEELVVEARRVIKLREMADIQEMHDSIADRFRDVFKVNDAKQRLLDLAAQKASREAEEEALRRKLEEAERRRLLGEARRRREEEARWRREMVWYYEELNEWMRYFGDAKEKVEQAKYELGQQEEKKELLRKESAYLMRAQVQLALRQGGGPPVGELTVVRDEWLAIEERLAVTEMRVVELYAALGMAEAALKKVPPRPLPPLKRHNGPIPLIKPQRKAWTA